MKTILSLFGLSVAYAIFIMAVLFILYIIFSFNRHIYFSFEFFSKFGSQEFNYPPLFNHVAGVLSYIIRILFWFILAPLFWVISFFRLKEIEV